MSDLIIASNRLPLKVSKNEEGLQVSPSEGGLATGLKSYHKNNNSLWIGWPGIEPDSKEEAEHVTHLAKQEGCIPIFLNEKLINNYYHGFSNTTLWPLFHYFLKYAEFNQLHWNDYTHVNKMFADAIVAHANKGATVWVQDYQLVLVPDMIRAMRPDLKIGFFLHIPFPSYEIIRTLPWREEIIKGILGADLIGFHTYDYARHFKSSVKRLLGHEVEFNQIKLEQREITVDVFPMGIDYEKFNDLAIKTQSKPVQERSKTHRDLDRFLLEQSDRHLLLSIDRLDYTKGIPERLEAFKWFLTTYPEYREKISLIMLTVPSREDVEHYQNLKTEVDVLVSRINGEFGTVNWNPVIYFYRSLPFENLIELYTSADIALLTPLRDGMNLVAKEFVACKINQKGVLILSEMAGAAKELGEAISVNPNNIVQTGKAIHQALTMPVEESMERMHKMQKRIKRYDIHKWASDFMVSLDKTADKEAVLQARKLTSDLQQNVVSKFAKAKNRTLFLDYDGTLQRFFDLPQDAKPDEEIYNVLDALVANSKSDVVLISGRDKKTFEQWFGHKNYNLIAEHGAWKKVNGQDWKEHKPFHDQWKEIILPVLESYVDRTPGSLIEDKTYSLVWHYRKADIELGGLRALELIRDVSNLIANQDLEILEGSKVIEIKVAGINKGIAAAEYIHNKEIDFVMAIGDDWTDEFLFKELPEDTNSIKVGTGNSAAKYYVENYKNVRSLLAELASK